MKTCRTRGLLLGIRLLGITLLVACGGPVVPALDVDTPIAPSVNVPLGVGTVRGRLRATTVLRVRLKTEARVVTFDAPVGRRLAFLASAPPAALPAPEGYEDGVGGEAEGEASPFRRWLRAQEGVLDLEAQGNGGAVVAVLAEATEVAPLARGAEGAGPAWLAIRARPSAAYGRSGSGTVPPRLETDPPWPGDAASFEAFKEAEVARYQAARDAGRPYVPSRPRYRLVPREGGAGETASDFVVLEWTPESVLRLDEDAIADARAEVDPRLGSPVLVYDLRAAAQGRMEALTRRNLGLPLAIVVGGRMASDPVIQTPLRDAVMITFGGKGEPLSRLEALAASLLRGGSGATLLASVAVAPSGAFEVAVPALAGTTTVELAAVDRDGLARDTVSRTFHHRPAGELRAATLIEHVLAALGLGRLEADVAADVLAAEAEEAGRLLGLRRRALGSGLRAEVVAILVRLGAVDALVSAVRDEADPALQEKALRGLGAHAHGRPDVVTFLRDVHRDQGSAGSPSPLLEAARAALLDLEPVPADVLDEVLAVAAARGEVEVVVALAARLRALGPALQVRAERDDGPGVLARGALALGSADADARRHWRARLAAAREAHPLTERVLLLVGPG